MYRIVLCDDCGADISTLESHLNELKNKKNFELLSYTDGLELLKDYSYKGFCDVLILDMCMDSISGIEVAKKIRAFDDEVAILIVTGTIDYAVEGYKVGAFRYIVKPVDHEDFISAVDKMLDIQHKKITTTFTFKSVDGSVKLKLSDIYYIESNLRSIKVVSKNGNFSFTGTISYLSEHLRSYGFIRIHKSFLVNIAHIYNVHKDSVSIDNKDILPMSKHKRKEITKEFISYMEANIL